MCWNYRDGICSHPILPTQKRKFKFELKLVKLRRYFRPGFFLLILSILILIHALIAANFHAKIHCLQTTYNYWILGSSTNIWFLLTWQLCFIWNTWNSAQLSRQAFVKNKKVFQHILHLPPGKFKPTHSMLYHFVSCSASFSYKPNYHLPLVSIPRHKNNWVTHCNSFNIEVYT